MSPKVKSLKRGQLRTPPPHTPPPVFGGRVCPDEDVFMTLLYWGHTKWGKDIWVASTLILDLFIALYRMGT